MKMLLFDFRESEKEFFETREFKDIDITFIKAPLNEDTELTEEQLRETDVISVFINSNLTAEVLARFSKLRIITTRSVGYNHIDLMYCTRNHIAVFNVDHYGEASVAQYTTGLIITLVRNLLPAYLGMKESSINQVLYEGRTLQNLTIGIIGCGAIGSAVAKTANFFGMKILVNTYMKNPAVSDFVEYVDLEKLLRESDIITLHIPYTPEVYHFISSKEFEKMKQGVYIINTARGELVDIVALYENLISGKVKGAALDVLECEYLAVNNDNLADEIRDSDGKCMASALLTQKLLDMDNVIITPHIAYNTKESVHYLLEETFNNIKDFSKGMHTNQVC